MMMRRYRTRHPRPSQQVSRLMPQHWALQQAFRDLGLGRAGEGVVTYVAHPVRGGRDVPVNLGYITVIVHSSHSSATTLLLHQAFGTLQLKVPISLPGMARWLLASATPPAMPSLTWSDLPIMVSAWDTDFVFPNAQTLHVFSRRLVSVLSVPHLQASLRHVFSARHSAVEAQVRVLGLVYERAARALNQTVDERVVPVAVQATLDMEMLHHPDLSWVNLRAANGHALLVHAAPHPDLVRLLLRLGADPMLRSGNCSCFLREVLCRLPGWQTPDTVRTLVRTCMSHVGILRSWGDDPAQVLSRLHDKVLGSPEIMCMLLNARFFTPSLLLTIPTRLPAHVRSFLERLLQRPLPLQTVCHHRLWDVLLQYEQGRRSEILRVMVDVPGLRTLLDVADGEAEPLPLVVAR